MKQSLLRSKRAWARVLLILAACSWGGAALAQADWPSERTGTVEFELAGEPHTFYTFAIQIPENVAEGMPEGAVKDRLQAAAGTTEHSATWLVHAPVVMSGIVLSTPTEMFLTLSSRPTQDANAGLGQLIIDFSLSLRTLEQSDPGQFSSSIRYYPKAYSPRDYYALTEGGLVVTTVEQVDDYTLRVQGSFQGLFSFQESLVREAHNPADVLDASGTFDVLVVGTRPVVEVLIVD
ncbi:MAG: hypothetical protein WCY60_08915 [Trueperaceae bacterium]